MAAMDVYRKLTSIRAKHQTPTTFIPRPTDVIIAGHPKSGTTWMQQILHQCRTKGDENFKDIYDVVPFLHLYKSSEFDIKPDQAYQPRIFKTHVAYEMIPKAVAEKAKFVVTIRDPYDSEYSFMKFWWRFFGFDDDLNLDDYKQVLKMENLPDFADFISSWWPKRTDPNVLVVPYEDLKADLAFSIQKIATFALGQPLDDDVLTKVQTYCSFEYMSKHKDKFDADHAMEEIMKHAQVKYTKALCGMVRADGGQVGQGKGLLSHNVRSHIDQRWEEIVKNQFDIENYEELYQCCSRIRCD